MPCIQFSDHEHDQWRSTGTSQGFPGRDPCRETVRASRSAPATIIRSNSESYPARDNDVDYNGSPWLTATTSTLPAAASAQRDVSSAEPADERAGLGPVFEQFARRRSAPGRIR